MERAANQIPVACFAPPLTDAHLDQYRALANSKALDAELTDAFKTMLKCVEAWWALPESRLIGKPFSVRRHLQDFEAVVADDDEVMWKNKKTGELQSLPGKEVLVPVVGLEKPHIEALDAVTPWMRELLAMEPLFDALPLGEIRDAAFHLLWHCKEITLDREPLTMDKLPG